MRSFGCFVELCALLKQRLINTSMSLSGRDILDSTVTMLIVVPENKVIHPTACFLDALKRFTRISRAVFQGSEQTLRVRIIITHRRLSGIYRSSLPAYAVLSGWNSAMANGGVCSRSGMHVHYEYPDPCGASLTMPSNRFRPSASTGWPYQGAVYGWR